MRPIEPIDFTQATPWRATLDLGFERRGDETILARRRHEGPLRIQKPLYPEGRDLCHAVLLHPPAGIAGGDSLDIRIEAGDGAHALLTTPGAGKWYRSAGQQAQQQVSLSLGAGARLEWLPQESIVFNQAVARMATQVDLAADARYLGIETICFGRRASGERFERGHLHLATDIWREGRLLWRERGQIAGGSGLMSSPMGLAGFSVCSTVLAAGVDISADTLAACRQITPREAEAQCGVTILPALLVARYLGHSAEAAREWFIGLWRELRPAMMAREAVTPRLWNT